MTYDPRLQNQADARRDAPYGRWCVRCEEHRTQSLARLCPCCADEEV